MDAVGLAHSVHAFKWPHSTILNWSTTSQYAADAATMPGISQPFPNIFDPANLLGDTGASNTKIRCDLTCQGDFFRGFVRPQCWRAQMVCSVLPWRGNAWILDNIQPPLQGAEEVARGRGDPRPRLHAGSPGLYCPGIG